MRAGGIAELEQRTAKQKDQHAVDRVYREIRELEPERIQTREVVVRGEREHRHGERWRQHGENLGCDHR